MGLNPWVKLGTLRKSCFGTKLIAFCRWLPLPYPCYSLLFLLQLATLLQYLAVSTRASHRRDTVVTCASASKCLRALAAEIT